MEFNPIKIMQLKGQWHEFQAAHPKFMPFLKTAVRHTREGSVLALSVTDPDGKTIETNLRMSAQDIEFLQNFLSLSSDYHE